MFHLKIQLSRLNMRQPVFLAIAACSAMLAGEPNSESVRIDQVGLVAPEVIGITLSARHVEYGRQIPYVKQKGDAVGDSDIHRFVHRDGKVIGTLVGKTGNLLCTMNAVVGKKLNPTWADAPASYRLRSRSNPHY
jgi:hypothetical protein